MKKTLLALSVVAFSAFATADIYGPGAGFSIPDNVPAGASSSIAIGTDITAVNSVTLRGLTHTWAGDLNITLSNGLGSVDLVRRLGGITTTSAGDSSNFLGDYTFAVGGADLNIASQGGTSTFDIPAGTYAPATNVFSGVLATTHVNTNFSGLVGAGSAGNWTLTISDNAGLDTGSLTSWEIDATPDAVPEPATMIVLGGAALAAAARRRKK